jgi:hypothetical protein
VKSKSDVISFPKNIISHKEFVHDIKSKSKKPYNCRGSEAVGGSLPGCNIVWICKQITVFRRNILPPFSGLLMKAACSSETKIFSYKSTQLYEPENTFPYDKYTYVLKLECTLCFHVHRLYLWMSVWYYRQKHTRLAELSISCTWSLYLLLRMCVTIPRLDSHGLTTRRIARCLTPETQHRDFGRLLAAATWVVCWLLPKHGSCLPLFCGHRVWREGLEPVCVNKVTGWT